MCCHAVARVRARGCAGTRVRGCGVVDRRVESGPMREAAPSLTRRIGRRLARQRAVLGRIAAEGESGGRLRQPTLTSRIGGGLRCCVRWLYARLYTICMQRRLHDWKCGSVCRDAPPSSAAAGAVIVCGCHYCSEDRICTASLCPSCWCRRLRLKKDESTGVASKMLSAQSSMRCSASVLISARKGGSGRCRTPRLGPMWWATADH